jgi:hypothetical protein
MDKWSKAMQQEALSLMQLQKNYDTEQVYQKNCFRCVGQGDLSFIAANMVMLLSIAPASYTVARPALSSLFDLRHRVSQEQNSFDQIVLDDLADGSPGKRHFYVVPATGA